MKIRKFALFDIGGTSIKYGITDSNGNFLLKKTIPTYPEKGSRSLLEHIKRQIDSCKKIYDISGIGISATGQVNYKDGIISAATDLIPGWVGTNIKKYFMDEYKLPVAVENDVNCVALGEMWKGNGRDLNSFISIALGTGIGGGIILNRSLFRGAHYSAGEFGHLKIKDNGRKCKCGDYGCYEAHASTLALVSIVKEVTGEEDITGKEIFEYEKLGKEPYKNLVSKWISDIGDGLKNIIVSFNPEALIIGGGVSAQGDYLLDKIKNDLKEKLQINFYENLEIRIADLKNDAGMLGALYLITQELPKESKLY
ncbi:ROK family protein [Fusobacteria bacterium ZRK30]|nr:ROK family protein [Fusobacteria bacterium ZRK30]